MIRNRSVPTDTVLPHLPYPDVLDALAWLTAAFGFQEHYRYGPPGGPVSGAQILLGGAVVMLHPDRPDAYARGTQSLTIFVEDVEAHFARTKAAGATIVEDLHETCYGELQYAAIDPAGHHWLFSRHARDLNPADWGAVVAVDTE
jgi:uncharacterized glyoxalase superfamily protein PhnB